MPFTKNIKLHADEKSGDANEQEKAKRIKRKNQRETEEMYKSFGSGFNPRQKSISFLQRFFFCNAIFIGIVTGKNLVVRSKEKTQTTTHPRSNQQEQQKIVSQRLRLV